MIITTRYQAGNYVATIDGVDVAKSPVNEHAAAKLAARGETVHETRPHVFKTQPSTKDTQ